MIKLTLDENVSPRLCSAIWERGHDVVALRDRDMLEHTDPAVWAFSQEEFRAVVTKNAADFLKLAAAAEIHAGLVIVPGKLNRTGLAEFIGRMITYVREQLADGLTNIVVDTDDNGQLRHRELCKTPEAPANVVPTSESDDTSP